MKTQNHNTAAAGIALMLFGCFCLSSNAAMSKALVAGFPLVVLLFVRSGTAIALMLPFTPPAKFRAAPNPKLQILRTALAAIEIPIYVYAVTTLPIADAMTYYLATPIYVTAISAFLGEKVGWRRWCAVLVGFAGVVIALRPSEAALSSAALIALSGSMLYAVILTLTGTLRGTADGVLLIGQHAGVVIICGIITAMKASMPTPHDTALMILIGVLTLLGSLSVNRSLKIARPSVVVPYQYSLLLWGAVFGYVFFDEALKLTTVIGAILIIVAGFYIFLREQKRAKPQLPLEPG